MNQSLQLSSIRTIQVCIGGGSDPASLYLPVIEMSLATYLCFILDFLRQIGDCIKRALEFENNSKIVALSRHKRKLPTLPLWDWLGLVGKSIQSKIYFVSTKPMEICTTTTAVSSPRLWRKEGTCCAVDLIVRTLLTARITWYFLLMRIFGEIKVSRPPDKGL